VACRVIALTQPSQYFPLTARVVVLAGCGAVGKACKLAFLYGTETDPVVAGTFLAKLTRAVPHTHVPMPPATYKTAHLPIPIKAVFDAFTRMPKSLPLTRMDGHGSCSETWMHARILLNYYAPSWSCSQTENFPSFSRNSYRPPL
jgi:hypothetical protein